MTDQTESVETMEPIADPTLVDKPADKPASTPPKEAPITGSCTFMRKEFVSALDSLAPAIKARSPKPILTCFKISQQGDGMTLLATDLAIAISCKLQNVEIDKWHDVAIPLEHFASILRTIPDETVELQIAGEHVRVISKRSKFHVWLGAVQEFPEPPKVDADADTGVLEMSQQDLRRMAKQTRYICPDNKDGWMMGVYLCVNKDRLEMMSTDGRRAAHTSIWIKTDAKEKQIGALIPTDTLKAVIESFPDGENYPITLRLSAGRVEFQADDILISSVTLEGRFMSDQVREFTTGSSQIDFRVARDELLDAMKQVRLVLLSDDTSSPDICMKAEAFMGSNNATMVITGKSIQRGEARVEVPIVFTKQTPGEKFEIWMNADYVRDGIAAATKEVFCRWNSATRPMLIDQDNYHYVLMPLNPAGR